MTMTKTKPSIDQAAAFKTSTEAFMTLSEVAFSGFERLSALNLNMARATFEDGISAAQSFAQVKDVSELKELPSPFSGHMTERVVAYFRNVQQIAAELQEEIADVMTKQMSGAAGPNPMIDIFTKVTQQATEMTKASFKTVAEATELVSQQASDMTKTNLKTATEAGDKMTAAATAQSKKSA